LFERLKLKWGIESNWQIFVIIVAFALAGSSVVIVRKAYFDLLGFHEGTSFWLKTVAYLLFIFPAYQILLLGYGTLLGQFKFFWEKEKAMLRSIRKIGKQKNTK